MTQTMKDLTKPDPASHDSTDFPIHSSRKRKANSASDEQMDSKKRAKVPRKSSWPKSKKSKTRKQSEVQAATSSRLVATVPATTLAAAKAIRVFVFGAGDGGELGLGPNGRNASRPRLNHLLDPSDTSKIHIAQFCCGGMHTIALTTDNKIVTWGVNDNGALGRDTSWTGGLRDIGAVSSDDDEEEEEEEDLNPHESTPTEIREGCFAPGSKIIQVAAGDSCSFALTDSGLVYGWGTFRDPEGNARFGYDTTGKVIEKQPTPLHLSGLKNITQIACGANHALALDGNGVIWGWGSGHQNQLGRRLFGRNQDGLIPRRIEIFRQKGKYIASGEYHALAVDTKDNVWAWGLNNYGQAGDAGSAGDDVAVLPHPVKIKDLCGRGVTVLDGGAHHSAAVTAEGICLTWGRIDSGQLGVTVTSEMLNDPTWIRCDGRKTPRICLRPTRAHGVGKVAQVACGTEHTIFIGTDGLAYSTGFGPMGQLGLGNEEEVKAAQQLKSKYIDGEILQLAGAGGQFSIVASLAGNEGCN